MTATIILAGICAAGVAFMVICLSAFRRERPDHNRCRVERILPLRMIDWNVDVRSTPEVQRAFVSPYDAEPTRVARVM